MKILKVKYKNHPVLKDLVLDFTNPSTGQPYNTIILIGENGVGKTTILSTISDYLNCISLRPFEYIEYEADGHNYHIEPEPEGNPCFHTRREIGTDTIEKVHRDQNNASTAMFADKKDLRSYACVFSKARADFQVSMISGVTTKVLDTDKHERDDVDNYTSLKQLFVDIDKQDSDEFKLKNRETGINWDSYYPSSRIYRFANAFDSFFNNVIKYDRIATKPKDNVIVFKKKGQDVSIDFLSTGEKQIVFRGAYLLKNNGNMDDGAVFIDEPELSMHPAWQSRVLNYFQNLYEDSTGKLKAQMFFASHSDYIVSSAFKNQNENLVIVLKEEKKEIKAMPITAPIVLPTITTAEVNYLAFNVFSTDFHIALYGYLQTLTGNSKIEDCDNYIASSPLYDQTKYGYASSYRSTHYQTLSTMIRNHIDHPDNGYSYNDTQLKISTLFLIELINEYKRTHP